MIVIAKYSRLEDAQKDAARISKRGIEVVIGDSGIAPVFGGGAPAYELQVYEEDMPKLEEIQEELQNEIESERPHACPSCGSKNYEENNAGDSLISGLLSIFSAKQRVREDEQRFKCLDCGVKFRVRVPD